MVGGAVGVVLGLALLAWRGRKARLGPGIWPLAALAASRTLSALWHGAGYDVALVACTGLVAYWLFAGTDTRRLLRIFGAGMVGVQLMMLGAGYVISRNLAAHLLLIGLCAWLDHRGIWFWAIFAAMISTLSKGAVIGLGAGLMVWWWSWIPAALAPVGAAGLWLLRPWRSARWRLACWAETLRRWRSSPWLGQGPGAYAMDHKMAAHAHNLALNSLLWGGVLELGLLAWGAWQVIRARGSYPRWALAGMAAVVGHMLVDDFTACALCVGLWAALLSSDTHPCGLGRYSEMTGKLS